MAVEAILALQRIHSRTALFFKTKLFTVQLVNLVQLQAQRTHSQHPICRKQFLRMQLHPKGSV
ncbi:hypothetical protein PJE062_2742 [Pseudovibrio sp. JE062]|nr:hypothetical protein PJE062_2742 [Pseudovibrio sp. JE062]